MAREEEVVAKRPEDTARIRSKPAFKYIFNTAFLVLVQGVGFLVLERESRLEGTAGRKRSYPATGYGRVKNFYDAHYFPTWPPLFPSSVYASLFPSIRNSDSPRKADAVNLYRFSSFYPSNATFVLKVYSQPR